VYTNFYRMTARQAIVLLNQDKGSGNARLDDSSAWYMSLFNREMKVTGRFDKLKHVYENLTKHKGMVLFECSWTVVYFNPGR